MNIDNLPKWHFELTEEPCNYLLELVLNGKKRATSSSLLGYEMENEKIPEEGLLSVITDWNENPKCIVKNIKVSVIPFKDITFDLAKLEGEDENIESWRRKHEKFFIEEGKEIGYDFSFDMKVVFEEFEVIETL